MQKTQICFTRISFKTKCIRFLLTLSETLTYSSDQMPPTNGLELLKKMSKKVLFWIENKESYLENLQNYKNMQFWNACLKM